MKRGTFDDLSKASRPQLRGARLSGGSLACSSAAPWVG